MRSCTHLVNSQYCDGSVGSQFDAPVFDQVRLQDAGFKHVFDGGALSLKTASHPHHQSSEANTETCGTTYPKIN